MRKRGAGCRGFGLVEVLVALAISAIGLLGEALLLRHCLAAEGSALRHGQAAVLLAAMAERIRMNARAGAEYVLASPTPAPATPACAASATCTPPQAAAVDLAAWLAEVATALPAARDVSPATIAFTADAAGTEHLVLELHWAEPGASLPATLSLSLVLAAPLP